MKNSIERELELALAEVAFWREFADRASGLFSPGETARIVTAYKMAERRLGRLERMHSRDEAPDDTVFCVRRTHFPADDT